MILRGLAEGVPVQSLGAKEQAKACYSCAGQWNKRSRSGDGVFCSGMGDGNPQV